LEEIAGDAYGQAEAEYRRLVGPFGRGKHGMVAVAEVAPSSVTERQEALPEDQPMPPPDREEAEKPSPTHQVGKKPGQGIVDCDRAIENEPEEFS